MNKYKKSIRAFMQAHYTDERLAQLLCHARDGKLVFWSCCCFIGIPTADHAIGSCEEHPGLVEHYKLARTLRGANEAERAFMNLMGQQRWIDEGNSRRRLLIPMIRAEMKRREKLRDAIAESDARIEVVTDGPLGRQGEGR
jgi:hypothetical protein